MDKPASLSDDEYESIEEAITRTAKGRAFLRRYARRMQGAATEEVRGMVDQIQHMLRQQRELSQSVGHIDMLRRELLEMAGSIEQARREVAALQPPDSDSNKFLSATNELDAIVSSTERASLDILNSAERLMDLGNRLRASGADPILCTDIENEVMSIFTACSFQDLTGQRTSKVINALRYIEQRINAMIAIWGIEGVDASPMIGDFVDRRPDAHLLHGPQADGKGVSQGDVDAMFDTPPAAPKVQPPAPEPPPVVAPPASLEPEAAPAHHASQADIDSMFGAPVPLKPASQSDIDALFSAPAPVPLKPASQSDIDALFSAPAPAAPAAPPKPASQSDIDALFSAPASAAPPKPASQSDIDALFASPAPSAPSKSVDQSDIDAMFAAPAPAKAASPPVAPRPAPPPPVARSAPPPVAPKPAPPPAAARPMAPPPARPVPAAVAPRPVAAAAAKPPPAAPPAAAAKAAPAAAPKAALDQSAIDALFG
ncbi:MAG: hypothetical protein P4M00_10750 [Azospirillaceae bacterium]|nr:hypothetical protein [Azospirillaceae bacterium]